MMVRRSYLYVPGDQPKKLPTAAQSGAEAIIIDLEDGVDESRKGEARDSLSSWLAQASTEATPEIWVRINSEPWHMTKDLESCIHGEIAGIVLPKATSDSLQVLREHLDSWAPPPHRAIRISPLIESARGLEDLRSIACQPQVSHLSFGQADLGAELGLDPSEDENEWTPMRLSLVIASAAAGIAPPVGPTWTTYKDLDGLRRSSERLRRLGFGSRTAIHPKQLAVIHAAFSPSPADIAQASEIVELFETAALRGTGVSVTRDGQMIDRAIVRRARTILAAAPTTDADASGRGRYDNARTET